jgi:hypothetical protein
MNNATLKKLELLKNSSSNYRLNYHRYSKKEMATLTRLASQVSGEKVTENDILKQFNTFHSAINHYYNVEKTLTTQREQFTKDYKYNLKFLQDLTNVNLSKMRKLEKAINNNTINAHQVMVEKRKIVIDYLQNAGDFTSLVENKKDVFTTLDYAKTLKEYNDLAVSTLYNDIKNLGLTAVRSRKQLIQYYTKTYADPTDAKATEDIIRQRSGQSKEKYTWDELKQVNDDNYNFINEILNTTLKIVLRNGAVLIAKFRKFAKKTIRIGIFWQLVDQFRDLNGYSVVGYNDYSAILRYMIDTLGVYGFSAYLLQDKFINNVVTIEVVD